MFQVHDSKKITHYCKSFKVAGSIATYSLKIWNHPDILYEVFQKRKTECKSEINERDAQFAAKGAVTDDLAGKGTYWKVFEVRLYLDIQYEINPKIFQIQRYRLL